MSESINILGLGSGAEEEKKKTAVPENKQPDKEAKEPKKASPRKKTAERENRRADEEAGESKRASPPKKNKAQPRGQSQKKASHEKASSQEHEPKSPGQAPPVEIPENVEVTIRLADDQLEALAERVARKLDSNWREWLKKV